VGAFTIVVLAGLVLVVLFVVVVAKASEGSSLDQFGLRSAQEITETRESLDAEDLEQMLAAHNARRRKRGQAELSVEDVEMQVMQDRNEQIKRRDALLADRELDQLLEATNARRRARGLPERTRDEVRREFGSASPGGDGA
jgi:predicted Holliday junction resolvase-like endonuclease